MVLGIYLSNSESHVNLGSGYGVEVGGWGDGGLMVCCWFGDHLQGRQPNFNEF